MKMCCCEARQIFFLLHGAAMGVRCNVSEYHSRDVPQDFWMKVDCVADGELSSV